MKDPAPGQNQGNETKRSRYLFADTEYGDEEIDGPESEIGSIAWEDSDFIPFNNGMEYIRKFEIVGLRWERYTADDGSRPWRLNVFFSDVPHTHVYGAEARLIMRAFELPEDPPEDK